jgi:hypothetical protein
VAGYALGMSGALGAIGFNGASGIARWGLTGASLCSAPPTLRVGPPAVGRLEPPIRKCLPLGAPNYPIVARALLARDDVELKIFCYGCREKLGLKKG